MKQVGGRRPSGRRRGRAAAEIAALRSVRGSRRVTIPLGGDCACIAVRHRASRTTSGGFRFMNRILIAGGLLAACLWQTGCCVVGCGPDYGCGRKYWGAYADQPPGCDPCDSCGNFVGHCGNRGTCLSFPWSRKKKGCGGGGCLSGLFGKLCNKGGSCCEATCESACECEPACGEPSCGEPSCGCGHSHVHSGGHEFSTPVESSPPPAPQSTPMTRSYSRPHATNVSYSRSMPMPSAPCNCNNH